MDTSGKVKVQGAGLFHQRNYAAGLQEGINQRSMIIRSCRPVTRETDIKNFMEKFNELDEATTSLLVRLTKRGVSPEKLKSVLKAVEDML